MCSKCGVENYITIYSMEVGKYSCGAFCMINVFNIYKRTNCFVIYFFTLLVHKQYIIYINIIKRKDLIVCRY